MNNNVIISIIGRQAYEGAEDDEIELVTEGVLKKQNGGYCLSYTESELTGLNGTKTVFDIVGDTITMTRTGDIRSQMVFQKGRKLYSVYDTPYGALTIGIQADRVKADICDYCGVIDISYTIEVDHAMTGESSLSIKVRKNDVNIN